MTELKVTLEHLESILVLRAVGPVDSNTAVQLQEPLLRAAEGPTGAVGARPGGSPVHEQRRVACLTVGCEGTAFPLRA